MSVAIKERDGYMCQWCLKNEGHINLTKLEILLHCADITMSKRKKEKSAERI